MTEHKISHPDMVRKLFKDPTTIHLTPDQINLLHAAVGLTGEAGEVLFAVVDSDPATLKQDPELLVNELGDMEFYIEALCQAMDMQYMALEPIDVGVWRGTDPQHFASHLSVAACGLLDEVKKLVFNNRTGVAKNITARLVQISRYSGLLRCWFNITRQQTLDANIAKLGARYDGFNYSDEAAAARRDEG